MVRLENFTANFEKEYFLASIGAFSKIINLDSVNYALIPVKKQFNSHLLLIVGPIENLLATRLK